MSYESGGNPDAAGNGLLNRRALFGAGAGGLLLPVSALGARPPWTSTPGLPVSGSSEPSKYESHVTRSGIVTRPGTTGSGGSRTPLQFLDGIITPSRLHFERHHSGVPEIAPQEHRLLIHGLVKRPLIFTMDALHRYRLTSSIRFIECAGNSASVLEPAPPLGTCGDIHGLISASEWTGVPLSALLDETGLKPEARWLIAEGADSAMMSRSIPLDKALDDTVVAIYQNGEHLRPSTGYPMRLVVPGWEGNLNVKWLRVIKVTAGPAMTRDETSKYSDLRADGTALLFTFPMHVKSVVTSPSPGLELHEKGVYQIKGIAWSGLGSIKRVEVSADGGKSWADAVLDEPRFPKCVTRFRIAWRWNGGPAVLMSRATDDRSHVQPTRAAVLRNRAAGTTGHINAIQPWQVSHEGRITNVHI